MLTISCPIGGILISMFIKNNDSIVEMYSPKRIISGKYGMLKLKFGSVGMFIFFPPKLIYKVVFFMARPSSNYSAREREQDYKFTALIYPDSTTYGFQYVLNSLDYVFSEWYYIYHDKDTYDSSDVDLSLDEETKADFVVGQLKKPHYHIVGVKEHPAMLGLVAKQLQIPSNFVQRCKKMEQAVLYLTHSNSPSKYQYSRDEIHCKQGYSVSRYFSKVDSISKAELILEHILNVSGDSKLALISWSLQSGTYSEVVRAYPVWRDIISEIR